MKQLNLNTLVVVLLLILPNVTYSQQTGIRFDNVSLSWKEVLEKAKQSRKYIFVDCFATWCGPCKRMEKDVYSNDSLTSFYNSNFIAVKIQMDSSKNDQLSTRLWYKDAMEIAKQYQVDAFPTLLFFSPDGNLVNKEVGYHDVNDFLNISMNSLDVNKQFYTLIKGYKNGEVDYKEFPTLANKARQLKEYELSREISNNYIENFLSKLSPEKLFTKENIKFIASFTQTSSDKGFLILLKNVDGANAAMNTPYFAQQILNYIIYMENIHPTLTKIATSNPTQRVPWDSLYKSISGKYNINYANIAVSNGKINWYAYKKDWPSYTKSIVKYCTKNENSISNDDLNDFAWRVFLYSDNKVEISRAIKWMKEVISTERDTIKMLPNFLDTYANLLYKRGKAVPQLNTNNEQ